MPIYEYRCEACGKEQEFMQKISDDPLVVCPLCHQPALKKLISAAGFRLKGGGWYETDFKSGKKKNLHETGKKDSAETKSKTDKSSSGNSKSTASGSS